MALFKELGLSRLREGLRGEFHAEAFNIFNHLQFQRPDATVGASDVGAITSTVNNPRQLRLALTFYF